MKKIVALPAVFLLSISLAACGTSGSAPKAKETNGAEAKADQKDTELALKKGLVKFYSKLTGAVNEQDRDLNAYEASEEKPTDEMKSAAAASAEKTAAALKSFEVSEDVSGQKEKLQSVVEKLAKSYEEKAAELKKPAPSLDAANADFQSANDSLGEVYESAKMYKLDMNSAVNS
ncbi:hypothetical protein LRR81_15040 [Metabacillus sp. GX 13764]|uniref:hypothetical protein n=1 Tax=Metabacillus kandeliae TaxID=2900151 RepID=UPI001E29E0BC|nr:hypothetical protein [Metabacillus kandeliae]MCD7035560.1 hypothetical protein [Metabacillus kandeliae]